MSLPSALSTITVTGNDLSTFDGTPLNGVIIFMPSRHIVGAGAVLEGAAVMTVTAGVAVPITLPCTDSVSPPFTYTIDSRLATPDGVDPAPVTGVSIPGTMKPTVDVSQFLA